MIRSGKHIRKNESSRCLHPIGSMGDFCRRSRGGHPVAPRLNRAGSQRRRTTAGGTFHHGTFARRIPAVIRLREARSKNESVEHFRLVGKTKDFRPPPRFRDGFPWWRDTPMGPVRRDRATAAANRTDGLPLTGFPRRFGRVRHGQKRISPVPSSHLKYGGFSVEAATPGKTPTAVRHPRPNRARQGRTTRPPRGSVVPRRGILPPTRSGKTGRGRIGRCLHVVGIWEIPAGGALLEWTPRWRGTSAEPKRIGPTPLIHRGCGTPHRTRHRQDGNLGRLKLRIGDAEAGADDSGVDPYDRVPVHGTRAILRRGNLGRRQIRISPAPLSCWKGGRFFWMRCSCGRRLW